MDILTRADGKKFDKVRLIGSGSNEIVPFDRAFSMAEDNGLDLVCVSEDSDPPVVRIQDYKKLEFEKKKARKAQRAKTKSSELKEVQLRINISDHDLETKLTNVRKFLERGDKVKLSVRLKGRERSNPERARELLERVAGMVQCKVSQERGPATMAILEPEK